MMLATVLNEIPGVVALHEGQEPDEARAKRLPLINVQNRQAWSSSEAARTVVDGRRSAELLAEAANGAGLIVDVAFYNAPLIAQLAAVHPDAAIIAVVRGCEGFVRSATILEGEDLQPAGWPDPAKPLTDRERFVEIGRLRPDNGSPAGQCWPEWSGVQRNIWLWATINGHLMDYVARSPQATMLHFEELRSAPARFWTECLAALNLYTPANVARCLAGSTRPVNARTSYQVGPLSTWSPAERNLYDQLARPLEERFHD